MKLDTDELEGILETEVNDDISRFSLLLEL